MLWILKNSFLSRSRIFSSFSSSSNPNQGNGNKTPRTSCGYDKLATADDDNNNQDDNIAESTAPTEEKANVPQQAKQKSGFNDDDFESEYESEDERLICWVCDRSFSSIKSLERHKRQERHYGCGTCEAVFPSFIALETHREEEDHWSDDADFEDEEEQFSSIETDDECDVFDEVKPSAPQTNTDHLFLL